jgi:short-subunit dehydrogenase
LYDSSDPDSSKIDFKEVWNGHQHWFHGWWVIINLGLSVIKSGKVPSSLLATYSATKAFLRSFSQALGMEVKPQGTCFSQGVHVEHINTYFVSTKMSKIRKPSFLAPSAKVPPNNTRTT